MDIFSYLKVYVYSWYNFKALDYNFIAYVYHNFLKCSYCKSTIENLREILENELQIMTTTFGLSYNTIQIEVHKAYDETTIHSLKLKVATIFNIWRIMQDRWILTLDWFCFILLQIKIAY